jgi:hypothetical protein
MTHVYRCVHFIVCLDTGACLHGKRVCMFMSEWREKYRKQSDLNMTYVSCVIIHEGYELLWPFGD